MILDYFVKHTNLHTLFPDGYLTILVSINREYKYINWLLYFYNFILEVYQFSNQQRLTQL